MEMLLFCNGCRSLFKSQEYPEYDAAVRAVNPMTGEEHESHVFLCPDCKKRLEKGKPLYPFEGGK